MNNIFRIIFRHGVEANRLSITPERGEPIYTTDEHKLYVGDSTTPGGIPVKCDLGSIAGIPFACSSPSDGDTIVYNATSGQWECAAGGGGGGGCTTLDCLTDVSAGSPSNNDTLVYNSGTGQWENTPLVLDTLADVNTSGATANQVLSYNGTSWVPATVSGGGGPHALNDHTDVTISSPQDDQYIVYNSTSGVWENVTGYQLKVSNTDTTPDFLSSKISAGTGISLTVQNSGANEQLEISAAGAGYAMQMFFAGFGG